MPIAATFVCFIVLPAAAIEAALFGGLVAGAIWLPQSDELAAERLATALAE